MTRDDFYQQLLSAASRQGVLLTATRRLGRHLLGRYSRWQAEQGRSAWLTPAIMNPEAWLERQLALLGEDWRLLGPTAVRRLWEEVIEEDAAARGLALLQVPASAAKALEAHEILAEYAADIDPTLVGEDQRAFLRWRQLYRQRLQAGGWIDADLAWQRVEAALQDGGLTLPGPLLCAGFDTLSPRLERLMNIIAGRGGEAAHLSSPTEPAGAAQRRPCRDAADEVRCAARWARQLLDSGAGRSGIVAPQLPSYRALVERIFLAEIDPPALLAMSDEEGRFGLSLGAPLAEQGPAAAALGLLAGGRELSLEQVGLLLRTPYLGGAETEGDTRARFDGFLRRLGRDTLSLTDLSSLAQRQRLPLLRRQLELLAKSQQPAGRQRPAHWAAAFDQLLDRLGWPGERPLDSRDFQVVKAWREKLLPRFAALDAVSRPLSRGEAAGLLRRLAAELEFQMERPDPGLQVCGILEAGGLDFDHLWVLGLHENAWPEPPRPNPFIPFDLQRCCGMPHADAGREADFARRVMARLRAAAPQIVCSHPLQEGDCMLRPSPLIADLEPSLAASLPDHDPLRILQAAGGDLEAVLDDQGPPLPDEAASGGTAILRDQALCPFRAYARHRLAARSLEVAGPGLDPATRGTLVHAVLESFWRQLQSHERLAELTGAARQQTIDQVVATAVDEFFAARPPQPAQRLLQIERQRLRRLLAEWLVEVEDQRPAGAAGVATEQEHAATFGGLHIRTRIDRIDTLADGRRVLVDYKTGRLSLEDLLGEPLLEPQLPVYACGLEGAELAGVAIGEVRRGECALKGVARDANLFTRSEAFAGSRLAARHGLEDWDALLQRWRSGLERLGGDFCRGLATVTPVSPQKACRCCDLPGFCRIDEHQALLVDEEGPA